MISANWITQIIYVAAKLGIADVIGDQPKHYLEIAQAVGANPELCYRLLRALASLEIFAEGPLHSFKTTDLANLLRSNTEGSLKELATFYGEASYQTFGHLLYSVQTGKIAFDHVFGTDFFSYFARNKEESETFNKAMVSVSFEQSKAILASTNFSDVDTLIDVGGGQGALLAAIVKNYPAIKATLYDQPHVILEAKKYLTKENVLDRCQLLAGDFFKKIPSGADTYLLKYIIHDWDDEQSVRILKNCRQAMSATTKLLVVEQIIPAGNEPFFAKLADLYMFTILGSKERTEEEFKKLFQQAGLQLTAVTPTPYLLSVMEVKRDE